MPLKICQLNNEPGFKWGNSGACYTYTKGDEESINKAKRKAISQGVAIGDLEALGAQIKIFKGIELAVQKIGFDFDEVLSTRRGQEKWKLFGGDYVITARNSYQKNEVYHVTDLLNIPRDRVIFTGSNQKKIQKVKELGITIFYDNNYKDVIKMLPGIGILFNTK